MITEEEYDRIRFYLNQKRTQPESKTIFRDEFPLRQFIGCASCKGGLTAGHSKGRNRRYAYYRCHKKGCEEYGKAIPRDRLEASFEKLLKSIVPTPKFWKGFKRDVLNSWKMEQEAYQTPIEQHEKNLKLYQDQLDRLADGYIKGLFKEDYYLDKKGEIENSMLGEKIQRSEYSIDEVNLSILLKTAERYANSILYMWRDLLRLDQRKIFMNFVFEKPVLYHRKNNRWNHSLSKIFSIYKAYSEKSAHQNQNSPLVNPWRPSWNQIVENLRVLEGVGDTIIPLQTHRNVA